jgi:hypothetical protein
MLARALVVTFLAADIIVAQQAVTPSTPAADPTDLLARAREKLTGITRRLLKYTCLETIERTYYVLPAEKVSAKVMTEVPANSCDRREFDKNGHLSLAAKDRLRLEVAVAGGNEIHSWAAANRFDSRSVFQMVPTGPISSGSFGTYLVDVFENAGVRFSFTGQKTEGAAEVFEYDFEVPVEASHYNVKVGNEWKVTGYHGSFQIYAATAELARLIEETDELSPEAAMCRARTSIDYHYVLIGDGQLLIPRQSELDTLSPNASETSSVTTYSACHEYTAESSVRFDDADGPTVTAKNAAPPTTITLPPGIPLTLTLLRPIDTATAAAGDSVSAKVTKAVRAKDSTEILVPAEAVAHGRILQMRHQYDSSQFLISIRFDTLEMNGAVSPLSVKLDRELKAEKAGTKNRLGQRGSEFSLPPPASSEKGSLFVVPVGSGGYVMPSGFQSKWITLAK